MSVTEEMLMAYVDGELDAVARALIERAMVDDPEIAHRVARERALRNVLRAAYDPVLDEPVPERLLAAVRTPTSDLEVSDSPAGSSAQPNVIPLHRAPASRGRSWTMREWTAIAASLIVGALVSALALQSLQRSPVSERNGRLVARGVLASALTAQLASRQGRNAPVTIGITFLSKSGDYCRTFALHGAPGADALAGLACHDRGRWQVDVLARSEAAPSGADHYRPAASSIPQPVLDAASARMSGEPLDAAAEAAAQMRKWRRP